MAFSKALYFTALIPPQQVKEEVLKMKLEIKEKSGASHALKLPAHITITPPFRLEEDREQELFNTLKNIAEAQDHFPVELNDFGHFGQRVIFIKVADHEPVKKLHADVSAGLASYLPEVSKSSIHPHFTLATRDLSRENFQEAWKEFSNRSYNNSFLAEALYLLKHNGKTWDIIKKFPFRSKKSS